MKNLIIFSLAFFISSAVLAQTKAVTEKGDTVYLYDDGTWSFEEGEIVDNGNEALDYLSIELNLDTLQEKQQVSATANKDVVDNLKQYTIKYNDKKWTRVPPATLNEEAEFAFQSKSKDLWCVVISEETEIPKEAIMKIAKMNMTEIMKVETEIISATIKTVNDFEILHGVMDANFSGIDFRFNTYYYSDERGTVQFVVWTGSNVSEKYNADILELLNGFQVER